MDFSTRLRLSLMMFAQYFVWGVWWVPFGAYLSRHGLDASIGTIFSTQGWAAIAAPLFVGAIADRYFSAQKVMGVLHLMGGGFLLALSLVGADAGVMFAATLGVLLCYMPTIALSNTVAFAAMSNGERQFPAVRVFGTVGWILGGILVGQVLHAEQTALPIQIAGGASILYGLYAFTLPKTPPKAKEGKVTVVSLLGLDAIKSADRSFWTLIICSLLLMIPVAFYHAYANAFLVEVGVDAAATVQAIGQVSEVGFLLLLPLFFRWVGMKGVLLIGMVAWAVRYVLFANGFNADGPIMPLLLGGLVLHGICFDFFLVAGTIWVDKHFPPETRARAQSFLALVTWGVGSVIGSLLANQIYVANTVSPTQHDWSTIWLIPAALSAVVAVVFLLSFRDRKKAAAAA
jgi:nucleoside transporter